MSFGKIVLLLIVIYCIVKSDVKNGMEEYFAMLEAKKCELIADESEEEQLFSPESLLFPIHSCIIKARSHR